MKRRRFLLSAALGVVAVGALVGPLAIAGSPKEGQPEFKLPPGWTESDMQACIAAGTPGKQHEQLAKGAGKWHGKGTMCGFPGGDMLPYECTATVTSIMDGRYTRCEWSSNTPELGPFTGLGFQGFDNVSKQYVGTWIDNHSTGIFSAVGELSADGKIMTWTYTLNCPLSNGPAKMRGVERTTGPNTKSHEMFGTDPKTGKEFKMMSVVLTRQ